MSAAPAEKITVIIPVYKVEPYLDKCVQSVLGQTYENLEIILVDDGSPDGCPAMCEAYARADGRVRVVHKENGGLSSARNAGIDIAAGEYIGFVDADDHIQPDMYEKLLAALKETGADMSMCDVVYADTEDHLLQEIPPIPRETLTARQAYERAELAPDSWRYVVAWNKLYRRELFDRVRYEEGRLHEDEFMVTALFRLCERIAVTPDTFYWDVRRAESIMTSPVTVRKLDAADAFVQRYDYYKAQGWTALAKNVLRRAYELVWTVMDGVDVPANRAAVAARVRAVAGRQLARLDLHGLWLWLGYMRRARGAGSVSP